MDLRKLKKLIDLVEESGIAEIEVTEGEDKVRVTRTYAAPAATYAAPAPTYAAPAAAAPVAAAVASEAAAESENVVSISAEKGSVTVFDFDGTYDPTGIHNAKADAPVVATSGRTVSNAVR